MKVKKEIVMTVMVVHQWGKNETEMSLKNKMIPSRKLPSPGHKVTVTWEEEA